MKNSILFTAFIFIVACGTTVKSVHIPTPIGPFSIEFQDSSPEVKQYKGLSSQTTASNSDDRRIDVTEKIGMDWSYLGADVTVSNGVITIRDTVGYDYTGIKSPKITEPGTYLLTADVKAINVKTTMVEGQGRGWEWGKFQGYVEDRNRRQDKGHIDSHIKGTFDWKPFETTTRVADDRYLGYFRIGFQQATGTIMVKNLRIYKLND